MTFAAIKNRARTSMENHLTKSLIGTALFFVPLLLNGAVLWLIEKAGDLYAMPEMVRLTAQVTVSVLTAAFLSAVSQGREAWRFRLLCRGDASAWQIVYWLSRKRCMKAFWLHLSVFVRKAMWLLLTVPGGLILFNAFRMSERDFLFMTFLSGGTICFINGLFFWFCIIQRYALCRFLLAVKPELNSRETIQQSARLMDGKCVTAVRLKMSFLPWLISCVFLFPAFYVAAFYQQSLSVFKYQIIQDYSVP